MPQSISNQRWLPLHRKTEISRRNFRSRLAELQNIGVMWAAAKKKVQNRIRWKTLVSDCELVVSCADGLWARHTSAHEHLLKRSVAFVQALIT